MRLLVQGILRFRTRALALEAVAVFEKAVKPVASGRLWTVTGRYARCKQVVEAAKGDAYSRWFHEALRLAVDGSIDVRETKRTERFRRFLINPYARPRTWTAVPALAKWDHFGQLVRRSEKAWAEDLRAAARAEKGRAAADERKAARATKQRAEIAAKAPAGVREIALPRTPDLAATLADGGLVLAIADTVMFVAPDGRPRGTSKLDIPRLGSTGSVRHFLPLEDGRVLACSGHEHVHLITPGVEEAQTIAMPEGSSGPYLWLQTAHGDAERLVVAGDHELYVVELARQRIRKIALWADKALRDGDSKRWEPEFSVHGACRWGDRVVAWSTTRTACFAQDLSRCFEVAGFDGLATRQGLLLTRPRRGRRDHVGVLVDAHGEVRRTLEVGTTARYRLEHNPPEPRARLSRHLDGDELVVATIEPSALTAWDLATGRRRWRVDKLHPRDRHPPGLVWTPRWVATWDAERYGDDRDTTIALVRDGQLATRLQAGATILEVIALGDDALAARFDGRHHAHKILVWRDLSTKPRREVLLGHTAAVRGLAALGTGRLASWSIDGTLRIW